MSDAFWQLALSLVLGLLAVWLILVVALLIAARRGPAPVTLREAARLLPDVLRLVRRLAADATVPRGVRVRLWLLLGYLLLPLDLVPDFIPVIGWADDAIVIALVLRSVVRRAGVDAIVRHWPGSEAGLAATLRLAGQPSG